MNAEDDPSRRQVQPDLSADAGEMQAGPAPMESLAAGQYQIMVDSLEEGIVLEDEAERIAFVNPALCRLLDYRPEELIGQHWKYVVAPDFVPIAEAETTLRRQGISSRYENVLLTRHGERVPVISSVRPLFANPQPGSGGPGRLTGVLSVVMDIRQQKQTEAELRASQERFRAVFDTALDVIFIKDRSGRYVAVNPVMERILNRPARELIGKNDLDLHEQDVAQELLAVDERVLGGEEVTAFIVLPIAGAPKTFHVIKTPMRDEKGEIIGLCGIARDMSSQVAATEALRQSEETLRSLIEQSADGITLVDDTGHIIEWNRALEDITELTRSQALGQALWDVQFRLAPGRRQSPHLYQTIKAFVENSLRHAGESRPNHLAEIDIQTASGQNKYLQSVAFPIRAGERLLLGSILRDISQRKQTEAEMARRTAQLESVRRLALQLSSQLDLDTLLESIVSQAMELMGGTEGSLYLYRPERDALEWVVALSPHRKNLQGRLIQRGEGLAGAILKTGQPLLVDHYSAWHGRMQSIESFPQGAMVGVPIRWGEELLGVLTVIHSQPSAFSDRDTDVLSLFAGHAAIAVRNARLLQTEREARELSAALARAAGVVTSTLDLDQVLDRILEQVERVVAGDAFNIIVLDGAMAQVVRARGYERFDPQHAIIHAAQDVNSVPNFLRMVASGQPTLIADTSADPDWIEFSGMTWQKSYVSAPIRLAGDTVGFLNVDGARPHQFDTRDADRLMAFADYCAIAFNNARLHAQTRQDVETKAILLREVNHRVKNNLAAIIGLLYAEQRHGNSSREESLNDLAGRIQGLGNVHSMLAAAEWGALPLEDLVRTIVHGVLNMMPPDKDIRVQIHSAAPIFVTPDQAQNLALIINELTTNSLKYAFPGQNRGTITITIDLQAETVVLEFRDDGSGYDPQVLTADQRDVGLYLVENLVRRDLGGAMHLSNNNGAVVSIRFKRWLDKM